MTVGADGNYRIAALPNGKYKVTLQKDGAVVSTRDNVQVSIASGSEVSFEAAAADGTTTLVGRRPLFAWRGCRPGRSLPGHGYTPAHSPQDRRHGPGGLRPLGRQRERRRVRRQEPERR